MTVFALAINDNSEKNAFAHREYILFLNYLNFKVWKTKLITHKLVNSFQNM